VESNISSNLTKSKNLISGKSPPNGLSCSVHVSNTVEALIFLVADLKKINALQHFCCEIAACS
jgi:hypothetical protein